MSALYLILCLLALYPIIRGTRVLYRISVTQYDEAVAQLRRAQR